MAKNIQGLTTGTFPTTTSTPTGSPFVLAEDVRGGGMIVVANDSDRALLNEQGLENRMIVWHVADSEYQIYNAGDTDRNSDGTLTGGTWERLQLGADAGFGLDTEIGASGNLIFNVDSDVIATRDFVREEAIGYNDWGNVIVGLANTDLPFNTSNVLTPDHFTLLNSTFNNATTLQTVGVSSSNIADFVGDKSFAQIRITVVDTDSAFTDVLVPGAYSIYDVVSSDTDSGGRITYDNGQLDISTSDTDILAYIQTNANINGDTDFTFRIEGRERAALAVPLFSTNHEGAVNAAPDTEQDFIGSDHRWRKLVNSPLADGNSVVISKNDSELLLSVDTEWLANHFNTTTTFGDLSNINPNVDNPQEPPSLAGITKRNLIYDQTVNEWAAGRDFINFDFTASNDTDALNAQFFNNGGGDTNINQPQNVGFNIYDTDDLNIRYDTDSDLFEVISEVGVRAGARFRGFTGVVQPENGDPNTTVSIPLLQNSSHEPQVYFQWRRPSDADWVNLTDPVPWPNATTVFSFLGFYPWQTDDFIQADTDIPPGTKYRAQFISQGTTNAIARVFDTASFELDGAYGVEPTFDDSNSDIRNRTQNSFLVYHQQPVNSVLPDRWVSTRLIEDFSDTDDDALKVGIDSDVQYIQGSIYTNDQSPFPALTSETPIRFVSGLTSSPVFTYHTGDNSFEYQGAKDTDITITISNLNLQLSNASYTEGSAATDTFFSLERSVNGGVSYTELEKSTIVNVDENTNSTDLLQYGTLTHTETISHGWRLRLVYTFDRPANVRTSILVGTFDSDIQMTMTGSYHILTGGFASQEYVRSEAVFKSDVGSGLSYDNSTTTLTVDTDIIADTEWVQEQINNQEHIPPKFKDVDGTEKDISVFELESDGTVQVRSQDSEQNANFFLLQVKRTAFSNSIVFSETDSEETFPFSLNKSFVAETSDGVVEVANTVAPTRSYNSSENRTDWTFVSGQVTYHEKDGHTFADNALYTTSNHNLLSVHIRSLEFTLGDTEWVKSYVDEDFITEKTYTDWNGGHFVSKTTGVLGDTEFNSVYYYGGKSQIVFNINLADLDEGGYFKVTVDDTDGYYLQVVSETQNQNAQWKFVAGDVDVLRHKVDGNTGIETTIQRAESAAAEIHIGYGLTHDGAEIVVDTDVIADTDFVKTYVNDHAADSHIGDDQAGYGLNLDTESVMAGQLSVDTDVIADTEWVKDNYTHVTDIWSDVLPNGGFYTYDANAVAGPQTNGQGTMHIGGPVNYLGGSYHAFLSIFDSDDSEISVADRSTLITKGTVFRVTRDDTDITYYCRVVSGQYYSLGSGQAFVAIGFDVYNQTNDTDDDGSIDNDLVDDTTRFKVELHFSASGNGVFVSGSTTDNYHNAPFVDVRNGSDGQNTISFHGDTDTVVTMDAVDSEFVDNYVDEAIANDVDGHSISRIVYGADTVASLAGFGKNDDIIFDTDFVANTTYAAVGPLPSFANADGDNFVDTDVTIEGHTFKAFKYQGLNSTVVSAENSVSHVSYGLATLIAGGAYTDFTWGLAVFSSLPTSRAFVDTDIYSSVIDVPTHSGNYSNSFGIPSVTWTKRSPASITNGDYVLAFAKITNGSTAKLFGTHANNSLVVSDVNRYGHSPSVNLVPHLDTHTVKVEVDTDGSVQWEYIDTDGGVTTRQIVSSTGNITIGGATEHAITIDTETLKGTGIVGSPLAVDTDFIADTEFVKQYIEDEISELHGANLLRFVDTDGNVSGLYEVKETSYGAELEAGLVSYINDFSYVARAAGTGPLELFTPNNSATFPIPSGTAFVVQLSGNRYAEVASNWTAIHVALSPSLSSFTISASHVTFHNFPADGTTHNKPTDLVDIYSVGTETVDLADTEFVKGYAATKIAFNTGTGDVKRLELQTEAGTLLDSALIDSDTGITLSTGSDAITIGVDTDVIADTEWVKAHVSDNTNDQFAATGTDAAQANGTSSIAIGDGAGTGNAASNSIALGHGASVTESNRLVIGQSGSSGISSIETPGFTGGDHTYISVDANGLWSTSVVTNSGVITAGTGISVSGSTVSVDTDVIADTDWVKADYLNFNNTHAYTDDTELRLTMTDPAIGVQQVTTLTFSAIASATAVTMVLQRVDGSSTNSQSWIVLNTPLTDSEAAASFVTFFNGNATFSAIASAVATGNTVAVTWTDSGTITNGGGTGFTGLNNDIPFTVATTTAGADTFTPTDHFVEVTLGPGLTNQGHRGIQVEGDLSSYANQYAESLEAATDAFPHNAASASGGDALAIGTTSTASDSEATAVGLHAMATGKEATAVGWNAIADTDGSTAVGRQATARGLGAVAIGQNSNAPHNFSGSLGNKTPARIGEWRIGHSGEDENGNALALHIHAGTTLTVDSDDSLIDRNYADANYVAGDSRFHTGNYSTNALRSPLGDNPGQLAYDTETGTGRLLVQNNDNAWQNVPTVTILGSPTSEIDTNAPIGSLIVRPQSGGTTFNLYVRESSGFIQFSGGTLVGDSSINP